MFGKLVDGISSYEILNNIIPGTVYVAITERCTTLSFRSGDIWSDLVIYYFIGLVIGRIGSLLVEPAIRRYKQSNKSEYESEYKDYINAELKDNRLRELSAICNMYRSFISVFLCLILTFAFYCCLSLIRDNVYRLWLFRIIGCLVLIFIFFCSFVKQNKYLIERIIFVNNNGIK